MYPRSPAVDVAVVTVAGTLGRMSSESSGADRVDFGEASLGEAQSSNPPDDPEMLYDDAGELDADVDYEGEGEPPAEERGNDDPAPNVP